MQKSNLKSGVDWADLRYNPVQGLCPNTDCSIYADCYMKRYPFRFSVDRNPTLRLDEKKLMVKLPDEPQRIFVQDNLELFHEKIPAEWILQIIDRTKVYPQHTFIFLTKLPAGYARFDFPKNCWLGVTVTKEGELGRIEQLWEQSPKNLIFVSFEPLLGPFTFIPKIPDWIIIGALTGPKAKSYAPRMSWIAEIRDHAHDHNVPVFEKDNLKEVWGPDLIQEHPNPR